MRRRRLPLCFNSNGSSLTEILFSFISISLSLSLSVVTFVIWHSAAVDTVETHLYTHTAAAAGGQTSSQGTWTEIGRLCWAALIRTRELPAYHLNTVLYCTLAATHPLRKTKRNSGMKCHRLCDNGYTRDWSLYTWKILQIERRVGRYFNSFYCKLKRKERKKLDTSWKKSVQRMWLLSSCQTLFYLFDSIGATLLQKSIG